MNIFVRSFAAVLFAASIFSAGVSAQTRPAVTRIDEAALKKLIEPSSKPLLVNFWATWCVPCREEFPDLVKLDKKYDEKIDFITISLDDLAEINTSVPQFLLEMKAKMPAYLLRASDENAAILSVTENWQGGLPFTILFDKDGNEIYLRQGKIKLETVSEKIDSLIGTTAGDDKK